MIYGPNANQVVAKMDNAFQRLSVKQMKEYVAIPTMIANLTSAIQFSKFVNPKPWVSCAKAVRNVHQGVALKEYA